ncbi:MAG: hypothetical protein ABW189_07685 [Rickettsiales bacterium]
MLCGISEGRIFLLYPAGGHITVSREDGSESARYAKADCLLAFTKEGENRGTILRVAPQNEAVREFFFDAGQEIEELTLWYRPQTRLHKHPNYAFTLLVAVLAAILVALIWGAVQKTDAAANAVVQFTPRSWEKPLANLALSQLRARQVCKGEDGLRLISRLMQPLLKNVGLDGVGMVKIIFVKGENGVKSVALPGGVIVAESPLLERANSVDFIVAALAREMIEVKERRPLRRAVAKLGAYAVSFAALPLMAATESAALVAGKIVRDNYDRAVTRKTDVEAALLMQKSGFSPRGMADYLTALGYPASLVSSYGVDNPALPPVRPLNAAQKKALRAMCEK